MVEKTIFGLTEDTTATATTWIPTQKTSAATDPKKISLAVLGGLEIEAISTQSGNKTGTVGKLTCWTMAGEAANRDFVLPASANVGERCGIYIIDGDASDEILIKANDDTDKIGNTASFNTTEFTRLFIENECMIFRCVNATNPDWIVEYDGRIPCECTLYLSTSADGESDNTYTRPTQASTPGAWTEDIDNYNGGNVSNDRIDIRRDGNYNISMVANVKDANSVASYMTVRIVDTSTNYFAYIRTDEAASGDYCNIASSSTNFTLSEGDWLQFQYKHLTGGAGLNSSGKATRFGIIEIL